MAVPARAGIDLAGQRFRYAVVHVGQSGNRLLRMGECEFDFVCEEVLSDPGREGELSVLTDALREALGPTPPPVVRFAMRPPVVRTFVSTSPARGKQTAQREARILGLSRADTDLLRIDALSDDGSGRCLVTVQSPVVHDTLTEICAELGASGFEIVPGLYAAGELVRGMDRSDGSVLAVGLHETAVEVVVLEGRAWTVGTAAHDPRFGLRNEPIDALVGRVGIARGDARRFRYGSVTPHAGTTGFGDMAPVNPLGVLQHDASGVDPGAEAVHYTTAIGAAILQGP